MIKKSKSLKILKLYTRNYNSLKNIKHFLDISSCTKDHLFPLIDIVSEMENLTEIYFEHNKFTKIRPKRIANHISKKLGMDWKAADDNGCFEGVLNNI